MAKQSWAANPETLFPILPSGPVGMARLAAAAEHTDDGHLIEFKTMEARSILNKTVSKRGMWMNYSISTRTEAASSAASIAMRAIPMSFCCR